jgi:SAM-dependent methyltransferase
VYTKSAAFYDAIYSFKDYPAESARLVALIAQHKRSRGRRLLDVACGTGSHLQHLMKHFDGEGIDASAEQLAIARAKCPGTSFHRGDMLDFDLSRQFDVVTCLFSSIGYVKTAPRLKLAVANLARHVCAGGVLIVEPWLLLGSFAPGHIGFRFVDLPNLKISRMEIHCVEDNVSVFDEQFMIGTPEGITFLNERHELGLFTRDQYLESFSSLGLATTWDDRGLMGRGLMIGVKP